MTRRYDDPADYLTSEEGEPEAITAALGDVARARGFSRLAREAGLSHDRLRRAVSGDGDPEFDTILRISRALGFRLAFLPVEKTDSEEADGTGAL